MLEVKIFMKSGNVIEFQCKEIVIDRDRLGRLTGYEITNDEGIDSTSLMNVDILNIEGITVKEIKKDSSSYEKLKAEIIRAIARNCVAWDTSKDKKESLLPEVYYTNIYLYKELIGEDYNFRKACKKFHIGEEYL